MNGSCTKMGSNRTVRRIYESREVRKRSRGRLSKIWKMEGKKSEKARRGIDWD